MVPSVGVLGCNFVASNLVPSYAVYTAARFPYSGVARRVELESGSSGYWCRVGSASCCSFTGRECYESWVNLLSPQK